MAFIRMKFENCSSVTRAYAVLAKAKLSQMSIFMSLMDKRCQGVTWLFFSFIRQVMKPRSSVPAIWMIRNEKAMDANNRKRDPLPDETADIETIIAFWDTHSTADYEDEMEDVDVEMDLQEEIYVVRLIPELADIIGRNAKARGVSTETLVNLWLAEKAGIAAPTG